MDQSEPVDLNHTAQIASHIRSEVYSTDGVATEGSSSGSFNVTEKQPSHEETKTTSNEKQHDDSSDVYSETHCTKADKKRQTAAPSRKQPTVPRSRKQPNVEKSKPRPPPPKYIIQEWHIVLGDTHARADRTTKATELLRSIKDRFRREFKGEKKRVWIPLAVTELYKRLRNELFPPSKYPGIPKEELGLVLVRCTPKSMDRVAKPFLYGYKGDTEALFGIAQTQQALDFFLVSRDAPNLSHELARHRENLDQLQESDEAPPTEMMEDFRATLDFFQAKLKRAEEDSILSTKLLDSLKPINTLKEQWKVLVSQKQPLGVRVMKAAETSQEKSKHANPSSPTSGNETKEDIAASESSCVSKEPPNKIGTTQQTTSPTNASISPAVSASGTLTGTALGSLHGTIGSQQEDFAAFLNQVKRHQNSQQTPKKIMANLKISDEKEAVAVRSLADLSLSKEDSFRYHKNASERADHHCVPTQGLASEHHETPSSKRKKTTRQAEAMDQPPETAGVQVQSDKSPVIVMPVVFITNPFSSCFRDCNKSQRGA